MADLKLTIHGENAAHGATTEAAEDLRHVEEESAHLIETLKEQAEEVGQSAAKWVLLGANLEVAIDKLKEFGEESLHAFMAQEEQDKRLAAVTGELAEAYKRQAEELEKSFGVDAIKTEKMQQLLFQYGEAPDKIEETVKALLDYSARTGNDAVQATEQLLSATTTGRQAFKEFNLGVVATGDKMEDLARYSEALAGKFAGGTEDDAKTVAGSLRKAAAAREDMQKGFGEMIAVFMEKTQVVDSLTFAFQKLSEAMKGPSREDRVGALQVQEAAAKKFLAGFGPEGPKDTDLRAQWQGYKDELVRIQEEYRKIEEEDAKHKTTIAPGAVNPNDDSGLAPHVKPGEFAKKPAQTVKEERQEARDTTAEEDAADEVLRQNNLKAQHDAKVKELEEEAKAEREWNDKVLEMKQEAADKGVEIAQKAAQEEQDAWDSAADGAAKALASKVGSVLEALAGGDKVQASDILSFILSTGGSLAGMALGGPGGAALGGMLGGIAGQGVKGLGQRFHFHDGGWVDGWPRHHDGTWSADEHPAILQKGERVLSRGEVAQVGGPGAVDAMAQGRGGSGITVNVSTFDGSSAREYFEQAGGRALYNAVRTGRGSLRPLFGG